MSDVVHKSDFRVLVGVNAQKYNVADWLIDPPGLETLKANLVDKIYWKLNGAGDDIEEMSQAEKDVIDAADLPAGKVAKYTEMSLAVQAYIFAHYDDNTQKSLTAIYERATASGKDNRAAHAAAALDWVLETVLVGFYAKKDDIFAAATKADLDAITWDFSVHDAADPLVTIQSALDIVD